MDPALLLVVGLALVLLLQFSRVRRQQRDVRATRAALEVGSDVLTASGMVGTVVELDEATVTLAGPDGHLSRWVTGAVVRVLADTDPVSSRYQAPAADPDPADDTDHTDHTDHTDAAPSADGPRPTPQD